MFLHVLLPGSSLIVNSMEVSGTSLFALLRAVTMQDVTLFARKLAVKQSSAAARRKTDVIESKTRGKLISNLPQIFALTSKIRAKKSLSKAR